MTKRCDWTSYRDLVRPPNLSNRWHIVTWTSALCMERHTPIATCFSTRPCPGENLVLVCSCDFNRTPLDPKSWKSSLKVVGSSSGCCCWALGYIAYVLRPTFMAYVLSCHYMMFSVVHSFCWPTNKPTIWRIHAPVDDGCDENIETSSKDVYSFSTARVPNFRRTYSVELRSLMPISHFCFPKVVKWSRYTII